MSGSSTNRSRVVSAKYHMLASPGSLSAAMAPLYESNKKHALVPRSGAVVEVLRGLQSHRGEDTTLARDPEEEIEKL